MRVLVTNVYSYKNKGDAAIVLSLVNEINRVFHKPHILIQTTDAHNDEGKYEAPVSSTLMWILLSSLRDTSLLVRLFVPIKGLLGIFIYLVSFNIFQLKPRFLLSSSLKKYINEVERSDLVIACGGGYLNSSGKSIRDFILLAVTCLNFLTATYLGKKVCLYSQSVGPVYGTAQNRILRFTLNRVSVIEPREEISAKILKEMAIQSKVISTADAALLLGGTGQFPSSKVHLTPGRTYVGVTVRQWFKNSDQYEAYILAMANTISYLIETHNAEVFYVPQVIAEEFGDDDRLAVYKVSNLVNNPERFKVIDADLHPYEIIGICAKMKFFIGTRMHSNIFALINGVPTIAIEYEHKTRGIMQSLGLENLVVKIDKVTPAILKDKVSDLLTNYHQYATTIQENLPSQIMKSRSAIEIVKEVYETS